MYLDILFPPDISYGASGGVKFSTTIASLTNGVEKRNINRTRGLGEWDVAQGVKSGSQMKDLVEFFNVTYGSAYSFRYKDWVDFTVTGTEGVFEIIDATHFQLKKRYSYGAYNYDRKIQLPIDNTIYTTEAPLIITGGTVSSVDYATGIVTMSSGTPTSWTGSFHCKCRFMSDEQKVNIRDFDIYDWSLGLKEVID